MEGDYNIFCVSNLKTLAKDCGLQGYSKLKKADLKSSKKLNAIFCILAHILSNIGSILIK